MSELSVARSRADLLLENQELRARLEEAEETLSAIHSGAVDAVIVSGDDGEQVFTLKGADHPYRLLIEEMSEGGITLTQEGVILYANKRFGEMLGAPLQHVIGSSLQAWIPPAMRPALESLLQPKDSLRREGNLGLVARDGNLIPVHASLTTLQMENVPGYYCMVITDLSEHQRVQELLRAESRALDQFAESERSRRAVLSLLEDETISRQRLAASDAELRAVLAAMRDVVLVLDRDGRFCKIAPTSPNPLYKPSDELLGKSLHDVFSAGEAEGFVGALRKVVATGRKAQIDYCLPVAERTLCFEASLTLMPDDRVLWVARDVTERKQAEAQILRRNRLYATLSQINRIIAHATEQSTLFEEICRVASDIGHYRMAWIGLIDESTKQVMPVAFAGEERGYLSLIQIKYRDEPLGRGPTGTAIRENRCVICQDITTDPRMEPWRAAALERGYLSSASIPIRQRGRTVGAFMVYASGPNAFDVSDETLLNETASGISFALDSMQFAMERKQAEEEQLRLLQLLDSSLNEIYIFDPDSLFFTYVNQGGCRNTGYSMEELQRLKPLDLKPELSVEIFWNILRPLLAHEEEVHIFETTHQRKDGTCYPIQVHLQLVETQRTRQFVAIVHDVTERKQAEKHIRYQAGLLDNVSDAIIATDMDSRITSWNSAAEKIYGWCAEEALGNSVTSLLQTTYVDGTSQEQVLQQFLAESLWRGEVTQACRDGKAVTILASVSLVRDESGTPKGMVAVNRDITTRKQAEAQIQRQVKYLNALHMIDTTISSRGDISQILDVVLQGVQAQLGVDACAVRLVNAALQTLESAVCCGVHPETLVSEGQGFAEQAVAQHQMVHIPNLKENSPAGDLDGEHEAFIDYYAFPLVVKGDVKGVLEVYHRSPLEVDSEWLDFVRTLAGQLAIAVDNMQMFENLQRSKAELEERVGERTAELISTNAELEHASRVKDEFLANMSHELRTPLTSILGLSESLMEQRLGSLNDHQLRSLEMIESSGRHLLELINDILDLSKIESGKFDYYPQLVGIDEICRSSLAFIKSQATKKSIAVRFTNEAHVSTIDADPRRLKQILINLLTNAVKFTPPYGTVTLQVTCIPEQELLRFSVIDTGIGISSENLKRLFQPFVQLDSGLNRQQNGTGLGLALVQRLTDLHGGSVEVESEVGRGSRFTINLFCQRSETDELQTLEPLTPINPVVAESKKTERAVNSSEKLGVILLAEDNLANVLTISEYLESYGYHVEVAHDGLEAIEKAQTIRPDLILMDIQMPVLDGLHAMTRLRDDPGFAALPIIALTALAMPGDKERCHAAGASYYMSKPVGLRLLLKMINELLGK